MLGWRYRMHGRPCEGLKVTIFFQRRIKSLSRAMQFFLKKGKVVAQYLDRVGSHRGDRGERWKRAS